MKLFNLTLGLVFCTLIFTSCNNDENQNVENPQVEISTSPIEGTWKLVKTKWGDMEDHEIPKRDIYKIFTKERFFFIYFDSVRVSGAGGGTYTYTDSSFTESLQYYSWDHSAAGTQQTFNYTLEGDQLHQFGEIDGTDKYNDYIIDEYYERVEPGISTIDNNMLVGVWKYTGGNGNTSAYLTDNKLNSTKVITPGFWHVIFTEQGTGKYHGTGFGVYTRTGNQYTEQIDAFSFDSTAVGKRFDYTIELAEDKLSQTGEMNTEQYENFTVREEYSRVE